MQHSVRRFSTRGLAVLCHGADRAAACDYRAADTKEELFFMTPEWDGERFPTAAASPGRHPGTDEARDAGGSLGRAGVQGFESQYEATAGHRPQCGARGHPRARPSISLESSAAARAVLGMPAIPLVYRAARGAARLLSTRRDGRRPRRRARRRPPEKTQRTVREPREPHLPE